jgi:hypothetical protein
VIDVAVVVRGVLVQAPNVASVANRSSAYAIWKRPRTFANFLRRHNAASRSNSPLNNGRNGDFSGSLEPLVAPVPNPAPNAAPDFVERFAGIAPSDTVSVVVTGPPFGATELG